MKMINIMIMMMRMIMMMMMDTRWEGAGCVHSPGSNKRTPRGSGEARSQGSAAVRDEEEDRRSGADIDLIVNKVFSAVGFLIFVLLIIGVFIMVHNFK